MGRLGCALPVTTDNKSLNQRLTTQGILIYIDSKAEQLRVMVSLKQLNSNKPSSMSHVHIPHSTDDQTENKCTEV